MYSKLKQGFWIVTKDYKKFRKSVKGFLHNELALSYILNWLFSFFNQRKLCNFWWQLCYNCGREAKGTQGFDCWRQARPLFSFLGV